MRSTSILSQQLWLPLGFLGEIASFNIDNLGELKQKEPEIKKKIIEAYKSKLQNTEITEQEFREYEEVIRDSYPIMFPEKDNLQNKAIYLFNTKGKFFFRITDKNYKTEDMFFAGFLEKEDIIGPTLEINGFNLDIFRVTEGDKGNKRGINICLKALYGVEIEVPAVEVVPEEKPVLPPSEEPPSLPGQAAQLDLFSPAQQPSLSISHSSIGKGSGRKEGDREGGNPDGHIMTGFSPEEAYAKLAKIDKKEVSVKKFIKRYKVTDESILRHLRQGDIPEVFLYDAIMEGDEKYILDMHVRKDIETANGTLKKGLYLARDIIKGLQVIDSLGKSSLFYDYLYHAIKCGGGLDHYNVMEDQKRNYPLDYSWNSELARIFGVMEENFDAAKGWLKHALRGFISKRTEKPKKTMIDLSLSVGLVIMGMILFVVAAYNVPGCLPGYLHNPFISSAIIGGLVSLFGLVITDFGAIKKENRYETLINIFGLGAAVFVFGALFQVAVVPVLSFIGALVILVFELLGRFITANNLESISDGTKMAASLWPLLLGIFGLRRGAGKDRGQRRMFKVDEGFKKKHIRAVERWVAKLESEGCKGRYKGVSYGAGMSAISSLLTYCLTERGFGSDAKMIYFIPLYGCTDDIISKDLKKLLGEDKIIVVNDINELGRQVEENNIALVYFESPANPTLDIYDIGEIVKTVKAKNKNTLVGLDNTFATPAAQRPLEYGVDVVITGLTKGMSGTGVVMGAVTTARKEIANALRKKRDTETTSLGWEDAVDLLNYGLPYLEERITRESENALAVSKWLETQSDLVNFVNYPGLESFSGHKIAKKQMKKFGHMIYFDLRDPGRADRLMGLIRYFRLFESAVSLGQVRTLIEYPKSGTHISIGPEKREAGGIGDAGIRMSVGIEDPDDLIRELDAMFKILRLEELALADLGQKGLGKTEADGLLNVLFSMLDEKIMHPYTEVDGTTKYLLRKYPNFDNAELEIDHIILDFSLRYRLALNKDLPDKIRENISDILKTIYKTTDITEYNPINFIVHHMWLLGLLSGDNKSLVGSHAGNTTFRTMDAKQMAEENFGDLFKTAKGIVQGPIRTPYALYKRLGTPNSYTLEILTASLESSIKDALTHNYVGVSFPSIKDGINLLLMARIIQKGEREILIISTPGSPVWEIAQKYNTKYFRSIGLNIRLVDATKEIDLKNKESSLKSILEGKSFQFCFIDRETYSRLIPEDISVIKRISPDMKIGYDNTLGLFSGKKATQYGADYSLIGYVERGGDLGSVVVTKQEDSQWFDLNWVRKNFSFANPDSNTGEILTGILPHRALRLLESKNQTVPKEETPAVPKPVRKDARVLVITEKDLSLTPIILRRDLGCEIVTVLSMEDALSELKSEKPFDFIVVEQPSMSSALEGLKRMRGINNEIPVLIIPDAVDIDLSVPDALTGDNISFLLKSPETSDMDFWKSVIGIISNGINKTKSPGYIKAGHERGEALEVLAGVKKEVHKVPGKYMYRHAAQEFIQELKNTIAQKGRAVVVFTTGNTMLKFYEEVIALNNELGTEGVDWTKVIAFNLDEYVGLKRTDKRSYSHYMWTKFYKKAGIPKKNIHFYNGKGDPEKEAKRIEQELKDAGGPDIVMLGIGRNGHIAFNEPGTPLDSITHVVDLTDSTREANKSDFDNDWRKVPRQALTMGLGTIMSSKKIFLLATGESKIDAINKTLKGEVTTQVPASVLQNHNNVTFIVDDKAGRDIEETDIGDFRVVYSPEFNPKRMEGLKLPGGTVIRVLKDKSDFLKEALAHRDNHYAVFEIKNEKLGYTAYMAIHRLTKIKSKCLTVDGQWRATGGTRIMNYKSDEEALADALELAWEMSHKNAGQGLRIGGSKCAINVKINPKADGADQNQRKQILISYAKAIEEIGRRIGGGVLTGQDLNITETDVNMMAKYAPTSFVPNIDLIHNRPPAPPTGVGVFAAIEAAVSEAFPENTALKGKIVAIQGVGGTGGGIIKPLLKSGAIVIASDVSEDAFTKLRNEFGDTTSPLYFPDFERYAKNFYYLIEDPIMGTLPDSSWGVVSYTKKILNPEVMISHTGTPVKVSELGKSRPLQGRGKIDVFSPCAKGPVIDPAAVEQLKLAGVKVVCGACNNVLENKVRDAKLLTEAGIIYVPDYIANAGGVTGVDGHMIIEGYQNSVIPDEAISRRIASRVKEIIAIAREEGRTTQEVADTITRKFFERLERVGSEIIGTKKVLINGVGIIGSKVAIELKALGFDVYVSDPEYEKVDKLVSGYNCKKVNTDDILNEIERYKFDLIIDASTAGMGDRNRDYLYNALNYKPIIIYQGGEEFNLALSFIFDPDLEEFGQYRAIQSLKVESCNYSAMALLFMPILRNYEGISIANYYKRSGDKTKRYVQYHHGRFKGIVDKLDKKAGKNLISFSSNMKGTDIVGYHINSAYIKADRKKSLNINMIKNLINSGPNRNRVLILDEEETEGIRFEDLIRNIPDKFKDTPIVIVRISPDEQGRLNIKYAVPHESNVIPDNVTAAFISLGLDRNLTSIALDNYFQKLDSEKTELAEVLEKIIPQLRTTGAKSSPISKIVSEEEPQNIWEATLNDDGTLSNGGILDNNEELYNAEVREKEGVLSDALQKIKEKMGEGIFTVVKRIRIVHNLKEDSVSGVAPYTVIGKDHERDGMVVLYLDSKALNDFNLLYLELDHALQESIMTVTNYRNEAIRELASNYMTLKKAIREGIEEIKNVENLDPDNEFLKLVPYLQKLQRIRQDEGKELNDSDIIAVLIEHMRVTPYYLGLFILLSREYRFQKKWIEEVGSSVDRFECALRVFNEIAYARNPLVMDVKITEERMNKKQEERGSIKKKELEDQGIYRVFETMMNWNISNAKRSDALFIDVEWGNIATRKFNGAVQNNYESNIFRPLMGLLQKKGIKSIVVEDSVSDSLKKLSTRFINIIFDILFNASETDFTGFAIGNNLSIKVVNDDGGKRIIIGSKFQSRSIERLFSALTSASTRSELDALKEAGMNENVIGYKVNIDELTDSLIQEIKAMDKEKNKFFYFSSSGEIDVDKYLKANGLNQDILIGSKIVTIVSPQNMEWINEKDKWESDYYLALPYDIPGITHIARKLAEADGNAGLLRDKDRIAYDVLAAIWSSVLEINPDSDEMRTLLNNLIYRRHWSAIIEKVKPVLKDLNNLDKFKAMAEMAA